MPKASSSSATSGPVAVPPAGLADIFASLLVQVRTTTTTLAVAFKPPLTPAAVAPWTTKLEDQVARLISCVLAVAGAAPPNAGPSALVDEWREGVTAIGEQAEGFLAVLEAAAKDGGVEVKEGEQSPYLAHTGLVWAAVDALANNLPRDEGAAVGKKWESQKGTVKDAWDEFKDLLDADEGIEEDDEFGDDLDDEWGVLEAPMGKLDQVERKRAEAVSQAGSGSGEQVACSPDGGHPESSWSASNVADTQAKSVLALHQILHATLPRFLPLLALPREESYADLLAAGEALVAGLDDAVASLHPGQDSGEVNAEVEALNGLGRELASCFARRLARAGEEDKDEGKRTVASTFVQRWEARLAEERGRWEETRVSLSDLGDALE